MSLTALLEVTFKAEALSDAKELMAKVLTETRAFDGCESVEVLVDSADPNHWMILERWESEKHDAAYREFRAGPGAITELGPLLAGAPGLTKYETDTSV
ncbi:MULTISPECIES: antibiotic biosynthesis monooxygenase [Actinomycetes]|uniref:putative quinol monooxygenase n=1 Tax=Actinomycetes TaxID=1760 RepID=UPI0004C291F5|nr:MULTISPECIES: antibiotic biosynthesis monooxygenase [Actinomycetes]